MLTRCSLLIALVCLALAPAGPAFCRPAGPDDGPPSEQLVKAAEHGWRDVTDRLLDAGARPNARNSKGQVPLIAAVRSNSCDVVRRLLEAGASPNIQNGAGETALTLAAQEGPRRHRPRPAGRRGRA